RVAGRYILNDHVAVRTESLPQRGRVERHHLDKPLLRDCLNLCGHTGKFGIVTERLLGVLPEFFLVELDVFPIGREPESDAGRRYIFPPGEFRSRPFTRRIPYLPAVSMAPGDADG